MIAIPSFNNDKVPKSVLFFTVLTSAAQSLINLSLCSLEANMFTRSTPDRSVSIKASGVFFLAYFPKSNLSPNTTSFKPIRSLKTALESRRASYLLKSSLELSKVDKSKRSTPTLRHKVASVPAGLKFLSNCVTCSLDNFKFVAPSNISLIQGTSDNE